MGRQRRFAPDVCGDTDDADVSNTTMRRAAYDSKRNGYHKTIFYPNGDTYRGEWKDNNRHGLGTFKSPQKGFAYHGRWRDDLFDGHGEYWEALPNASKKKENLWVSKYVGDWKDGKRHGYGIMRYTLRSYYEGNWDGGLRHGWGRIMYEDDMFYEGEWADDQRNGLGLLLYPNNDRYEGEFRGDKKCGHGKFYFINIGQLMEGTWLNDVVKCSTLRNIAGYKALPVCTKPTQYDIPPITLRSPLGVYDEQRKLHTQTISEQYGHRKTTNLTFATFVDKTEQHKIKRSASKRRVPTAAAAAAASSKAKLLFGTDDDNLPDFRTLLDIETLKAQVKAGTIPTRNTSIGATRVM